MLQLLMSGMTRIKSSMSATFLATKLTPGDCLQVERLCDVARRLQSDELHEIPWCKEIWCTANFVALVAPKAVDQYLREVDALLCFLDGSCMLVSDREAHCLLGMLWDAAPRASAQRTPNNPATFPDVCPVFMNIVYARRQHKLQQAAATAGCSAALNPSQIASLKLWAGETQFEKDGCMRELVPLAARRLKAAEVMTQLRGTQVFLPCSDLEMIAMVRARVVPSLLTGCTILQNVRVLINVDCSLLACFPVCILMIVLKALDNQG